MLKVLHKIIAGLIIALGVLHVSVTFFDYSSFSVRALWFVGTGIAIILAGFINLILLRDAGKDRAVQLLCSVTNIIFALLFASALFVLLQPQVFVGLALFVVATVISLTVNRTGGVKANS
jgi:hypothetical protein